MALNHQTQPMYQPASIWPWVAVCAVTALLIDFGHYHTLHHGDSILPVLISLQEWTPYSWEQNRLGSLFPLLALPFQHPLDNLFVQHFFAFLFSLIPFFLLPRYVLRDHSWPLVGVVGASLFLLLSPERFRFNAIGPLMTWWNAFGLGVAGLLLTESPHRLRRLVPGVFLLLLSCWLNTGMPVLLGVLVASRMVVELGFTSEKGRDWVKTVLSKLDFIQLGILIGAFFVGVGASHLFSPIHDTGMGPMWPHLWPGSWSALAVATWDELSVGGVAWWPMVLIVAAVIGSICLARNPDRAMWNQIFRAAVTLAIAGMVNALLIGTLAWVKTNEMNARYWLTPLMLLQSSMCLLAVGPLLTISTQRMRRFFVGLGVVIVPGVAIWVYGLPSIVGVRADLDRTIGTMTRDILDAECTHVLGNFWDVWPAVYHANLTLADRGDSRVVWGIAHRAEPPRRHWGHLPVESFRFAIARDTVLKDDLDWVGNAVEVYLRPPDGRLELLRELPTIRVLHWKPTRSDD